MAASLFSEVQVNKIVPEVRALSYPPGEVFTLRGPGLTQRKETCSAIQKN